MNKGALVLNSGVGMHIRPLLGVHDKQRRANAAISNTMNQIGETDEPADCRNVVSGAAYKPTDGASLAPLTSSESNHLVAGVPPVINGIPTGMPLPKPPVLPNVPPHVAYYYGSKNFYRYYFDQLGQDEQINDEESVPEKVPIMCASKIYKMDDQQQLQLHHSLPRMVEYKSINRDEMIFLEAASALSRDKGDAQHELETNFKKSRMPHLTTSITMRTNSTRNDSFLGSRSRKSTNKEENERKKTTPSTKRRPIGPPPFKLPKIRKTILH